MRTFVTVSAVLAVFALPGRADEIDKEKLRKAARMPTVSLCGGGMCFDSELRIRFGGQRTSLRPDELARAEQRLRDHPDDPDGHYQLGMLRLREGKEESADRSFARAGELYEKRLKALPTDAHALAYLGLAQERRNRFQEAEVVLRRAVRVAPDNGECWLALYKYLHRDIQRILTGGTEEPALRQATYQGKPSRRDVEKAVKLLEESGRCVDKAVACAPRDPRVYATRGTHRFFGEVMRQQLAEASGKKYVEPEENFWAAAVADFRKAADLSPADPNAQGTAILYEAMLCAQQYAPKDGGAETPWLEAVPEKSRQSIQAGIARLKRLTADADPTTSAAAWTYLALVQMEVLQQPKEAETSARQGLRLDPDQDACWDLLLMVLLEFDRLQDAVVACKDRLKHRDSSYNRYLLAKVYGELQQLDRAEKQLRLGLRIEPTDCRCRLGLAALLLRRAEDEAALREAGECLDQAEKDLNNARTLVRTSDYNVLRGIHLALTGEVAEARERLREVLAQDARNKQARAALKALGK